MGVAERGAGGCPGPRAGWPTGCGPPALGARWSARRRGPDARGEPPLLRWDAVTGEGILRGADGVLRCWWSDSAPEYRAYHDLEWGRPVADDVRLFEKLSLEGFQSGLSWLTILRKREAFRRAFAGFELERVAGFGERDVDRLLADAGIVRHPGKIEAVVHNSRPALDAVETEGSFATYVWRFEPEPQTRPKLITREALS